MAEELEITFDISEGPQFDAEFSINASGTVWGSISGTLSDQTDLQDALNLKADKTDLDADVELINQTINENYTALDNKINTVNSDLSGDISALSNTVSANYTELSTAIQNEAITRAENDTLLQSNINTLSQTITTNYNTLDGKINTEISDRTAADTTLQDNIDAEALARQNADTTLQGNINTLSQTVTNNNTAINNRVDGVVSAFDDEIDTINNNLSDLSDTVTSNYTTLGGRITTNTNNITINAGNITTNANNISTIQGLIPNQTTTSNQLADKAFVNSSIATNTAYFIGTFNSVAELEAYTGTLTNNDYAFVATTDSAGNTLYDRYKWNSTEWLFEYELNNSSFTSAQWTSINSGATNANIGQIATNTSDIADLQTNKQDVLTAGANIQINDNVISATDTTYTAGTGISIVNNVISSTQTSAEWGNITGTLSNQTDLQNALDGKTLVTFRDWSVA